MRRAGETELCQYGPNFTNVSTDTVLRTVSVDTFEVNSQICKKSVTIAVRRCLDDSQYAFAHTTRWALGLPEKGQVPRPVVSSRGRQRMVTP